MTDWRTEAKGIPAWVGAHVGDGRIVIHEWTDAYGHARIQHARGGYHPAIEEEAADARYPDLDDDDTTAAFDRRLALRLGAPEDAVRVGVRFYRDDRGVWMMSAGYDENNPISEAWGIELAYIDSADAEIDHPLLARVRAWRSVKP